eukprot:11379517-Alexandrium_andersonii.AAC.1
MTAASSDADLASVGVEAVGAAGGDSSGGSGEDIARGSTFYFEQEFAAGVTPDLLEDTGEGESL